MTWVSCEASAAWSHSRPGPRANRVLPTGSPPSWHRPRKQPTACGCARSHSSTRRAKRIRDHADLPADLLRVLADLSHDVDTSVTRRTNGRIIKERPGHGIWQNEFRRGPDANL